MNIGLVKKYNFLWLLIILLGLISLLTWVRCIKNFSQFIDHNNKPYPGLSWQNFQKQEWQHYIQNMIDKKLKWRNYFIKINSEVYYTLFNKVFVETGGLIIGKNGQLLELTYIDSYCHLQTAEHDSPANMIAWADQVKQMYNFFRSKNKAFIYLITPSKVEYHPEVIPDRFHCKMIGKNAYIAHMEELLIKRGVPVINGQTLMDTFTQQYATPMFTPGGIHWNYLAATSTANAVIEKINQHSVISLEPLQFSYHMGPVSNSTWDSDSDLADMVKLFRYKVDFLTPKLDFSVSEQRSTMKLAIIGGSFNELMVHAFVENATFSTIDFYFYFTKHRFFKPFNYEPVLNDVDFEDPKTLIPILNADVIILEENAALTLSGHGKMFYGTLKKLNPEFAALT